MNRLKTYPTDSDTLQRLCEAEVMRVWGARQDGAHDPGHLQRVWAMAHKLALDWGSCDMEVVMAASFLHDIVNLPKDSAERNQAAARSASHAGLFLRRIGMTDAQVGKVMHAIEAHSFSAGIPPRTREAQVVQDADRLEALGALGIARCFNVSGQTGAALFASDDPMAQARALDDKAYALDHFALKLLRLPETMHSPLGKALARARADFMQAYRRQLLLEITAER